MNKDKEDLAYKAFIRHQHKVQDEALEKWGGQDPDNALYIENQFSDIMDEYIQSVKDVKIEKTNLQKAMDDICKILEPIWSNGEVTKEEVYMELLKEFKLKGKVK